MSHQELYALAKACEKLGLDTQKVAEAVTEAMLEVALDRIKDKVRCVFASY